MHVTLRSIQTTAGFLEHCPVEFAPGLTCIIGARGTCKSTLIESIRFAFDHDPKRVRQLTGEVDSTGESYHGLLQSTLGAGCVRCHVTQEQDRSGQQLVLEREIGSATRVFVDGVREHTQPAILQAIEIYSQGDLQRIAEERNDHLRLGLIDRANAAEAQLIHDARQGHVRRLLELGPELRSIRTTVANLVQATQPIPGLQDQLRTIRSNSGALPPELETERVLYETRQRVLAAVDDLRRQQEQGAAPIAALENIGRKVRALATEVSTESAVPTDRVRASIEALVQAFDALVAAGTQLAGIDLQADQGALAQQYEDASQAYYRLRQEQQSHNESLKQQEHLQRQLLQLQGRTEELAAAREDEARLLRERKDLRAKIAVLDDRLYELRIKEIEAINAEHGGMVHLTLHTGAAGSAGMIQRLSVLLAGSRIRTQDEVARSLAEQFSPAELVDIVESGDGQPFAEALQRDLGQMNRVVAYLVDHPELYTLEGEPPAAKLEITFFDNGRPKPVESLSKGQRATALLPLILRPLPYPLLVDQPEDDLDNFFIFKTLVRAIDKLKTQRQLIFVTHNANIPVLGDADRVVVMGMRSPTAADAPRVGSVDERKQDVLDLLEGGADAFRNREARYHEILALESV